MRKHHPREPLHRMVFLHEHKQVPMRRLVFRHAQMAVLLPPVYVPRVPKASSIPQRQQLQGLLTPGLIVRPVVNRPHVLFLLADLEVLARALVEEGVQQQTPPKAVSVQPSAPLHQCFRRWWLRAQLLLPHLPAAHALARDQPHLHREPKGVRQQQKPLRPLQMPRWQPVV